MDSLYSSSVLLLVVSCITLTVTFSIPQLELAAVDNDVANAFNTESCQLCYAYSDSDACALCDSGLAMEPVLEKKSIGNAPIYHPFLRGGYPKKATYFPYYNPILRGSRFKPKRPVYHPLLRGRYGPAPRPMVVEDEDDV